MSGKKENSLIIIENGQIKTYDLDNKTEWYLGRPSKDNIPDIKLHLNTVSRKHGKFQNIDGVWFYMDYNGKNGTVYNHKRIRAGRNGRISPLMLENGDVFVFGGGEEERIGCKTVFGLFSTKSFDSDFRTVDSKGYDKLEFKSGTKTSCFSSAKKGFVLEEEEGIAIYMGDLTYLSGKMELIGS